MPSAVLSAFQVITDTAWVMSPSSVTIGLVSCTVVTASVQPVCGANSTVAIGVFVGSCT